MTFNLLTRILPAALVLGAAPAFAADGAQPAPRMPVRLVFDRTDVADVLRAVAIRTRANIVFPAQTGNPITINVTADTVDEALRYITAASGLAFRRVYGTYVVATPAGLRAAVEPFGERMRVQLDTLTPEQAVNLVQTALPYLTARQSGDRVLLIGAPVDLVQARGLFAEQDRPGDPVRKVTRMQSVRYVAAAQVSTLLKSLYPDLRCEAVGPSDRPGGSIGLSGAETTIREAEATIRTVDVETTSPDSDREYRVYNVRYSSAPDLREFLLKAVPDVTVIFSPEHYSPPNPGFRPLSGATLGTSTTGGIGGNSGGLGAGPSAMTVPGGEEPRKAKEGDRSRMLVIGGPARSVDAAVKLLEKVDIAPRQVRVDVRVVDTSPERAEELGVKWDWQPFSLFERAPGTEIDPATGLPANSATRPTGFGVFSRAPWSIQGVLSGMITRKEARLLASPSIQVTDNDDANIFIGDTIRSQIVTQGGLNGTTVQIFEFPIGIVLLVRPRVNDDGEITMRVHPVVSTITSVDATTKIPQSSTREAETTVRIRDGETMVIGGLIREEVTRTTQEVPLLSRIPLLGELFRQRSTSKRNSEIMVFITPRIIR